MTSATLTFERDTMLNVFHQWNTEQESLDVQWQEALEALAAFQSHLDGWQQELCRERDALRETRDEWERERAATNGNREQTSAQAEAQLAEAREKVAELSEQLQSRKQELHELDQRRVEVTTELEQARAQANQLAVELAEQRQQLEQARAAASERLTEMQSLNDSQTNSAAIEQMGQPPVNDVADDVVGDNLALAAKLSGKPPGKVGDVKRAASSPVLGSIVEQFGKLRQQRASERQAGKSNR